MKRSFAWFQLAFAAVFTLVALGFGIFGIVKPMLQMREAQRWVQTSCVITQSSVVRSTVFRKAKRPSRLKYTLSLAYQYQFGGQSYRDTTYSFDDTRVSGRETAAKVASQFPVGTATMCWVNPAHPDEAVLKRDAQQPAWIMAIPIGLMIAGIALGANAVKTLRLPVQ